MKPPVEAPTSSARRPAGSMPKASSAFASLMPPRDTYGGASATATSASSGHQLARLGRGPARHAHVAGDHGGGGPGAGLVQAALGQQSVEPPLAHARESTRRRRITLHDDAFGGRGRHARRAVPLRHLAADAPHGRARVVHGRHQHRRAASCSACWWPSTGSTAISARPSGSASWAASRPSRRSRCRSCSRWTPASPGARRCTCSPLWWAAMLAATAGYALGRKLA